jgi:hypothetical protein
MDSEEAIIARGIVAMEIIIGVLELQKIKLSLCSCPTNGSTRHRVIQSIFFDASFGYKRPPAIPGRIILASFLIPAARLQMALKVSIVEILTFVIWQHINRFVEMEKAESSLIRLQIVFNGN